MIIFVSRHEGAKNWVRASSYQIDRMIEHLDVSEVQSGDVVIGSLPVNMVAKICEKGAVYKHLSINTPEHLRGKNLTSSQLEELGISIEEFKVIKV